MKRRRTRPGTGAVAPAAVGRGKRLSEGTLAEASVRARLLGVPLLRIDATVVLVPAAPAASASPAFAGDGLAEAVRTIDDGAEILARMRRDGRVESRRGGRFDDIDGRIGGSGTWPESTGSRRR